jgi:hypothetical protein
LQLTSHRFLFGNIAILKEDSRAMWTWTFAQQLTQDIRYALRMMAANRLFTAMAVLSLALGIGANTAIYSFMDAILLRSLPVRRPQELVVLNWRAKGGTPVIHGHNGSSYGDRKTGVATSPNFHSPPTNLFAPGTTSCPHCSRTPPRGRSISLLVDKRKPPVDSTYRADSIAVSASRPPPDV